MEDLNTEAPSIHELNTELRDLLLQIHKVITGLGLRIKQKVVQTASVLCMLQLLIFVAIFLYVSFYYTFMPTASFVTPVHFYYRTVSDSVCSIPVANFSLLKNGKKQVMTPGQPYQITLDLEMPESPSNMELGMFLVKISCYSYDGQTVDGSMQTTMLHYRSYLLQTLETLMLLPLMLMEVIEQKQHVPVELYSSYVDSSYKPTIGAVIEIHSQQVQIYKAQLYIHAHFSGIRYVLYHFPFTSAVVGVMSNFMFLSMIILIGFVQDSSLWPHLCFGKWNKPRERREDILEDTYQCERNTHSEKNCTGLEHTSRTMSTSMDMPDEDKSGSSSKEENGESRRKQLKAEGEKRDEYENNHMKEALLASRRSKPKLASAQAVLSSRLEPETIQKEPFVTASENPEEWESSSVLNCSEINNEEKETDRKNENTKYIADEGCLFSGEVTRNSMWRLGQRERWRGKRRERLEGRAENIEEEENTIEKEMNRGIRLRHRQRQWRSKEAQDEESEKDVTGLRGAMQGNIDGDTEMRGTVPHHIFSKVFANSFASSSSSSSSSFNYSSAESDEVFSEGEEMGKRKDMRRCRSWRTFLTMMQWSKRRQSSWVQLAGHQGNIQLGEGGEVLKKFNEVEDACLQALMSDPLHQFVPRYYGHVSRNGENYIRLEDLLSGLKQPVIMDCKMGIRTYQEEEIVKARTKASIRTDMYQKMVKVDPRAPTEEEHAQRGVTKLRYMQWRDSTSSTSTLGFRIEGIMTDNGIVRRDFNKIQSKAQVTETLLLFTKRKVHILEAYLSRLDALKETLKESTFFRSHEVIGGSLLFVHDRPTNKANIWMIDFGKTTPVPSNVHLKHDIPWVEGNREDGYLLGLASLISLLHVAIKEVSGQDLETDHSETEQIVSELNQHQPGINETTTVFLKETTATNHKD